MPLFSNPQNPNPGAWEPEAAEGRLAKTVGASEAGVFTSDLSVSEYVLLGEAGFEPLGFVVGSSIYHVGLQIGRWNKNQELQVLTQAMYHARELAMDRMRSEADHLTPTASSASSCGCRCTPGARTAWSSWPPGPRSATWSAKASGIVGVTVDVKNHVWGAHATEFLATGTAVRRLTDEHRLPETSPKPTFTLGLDN